LRILLLSAYDAVSHQRWRKGLVDVFPEHKWTVLSLPPRYFNWRVRGNSLTWAFDQREILSRNYDRLITTSMTDLSSLRGLVPGLAEIPTTIYFHENQFAYPQNINHHNQLRASLEAKVISLYSALSADRVVFNSVWNRDSFLQGVNQFLNAMPDHVPDGIVNLLSDKSSVLPVPLDEKWFFRRSERMHSTFTILWNHRWEYDKAPDRFLKALAELKNRGVEFRINLIGQQFRQRPEIFDQMYELLENHILYWGTVNDSDYRSVLKSSDVVVSSALHDFQGLAILEAIASGCIPVVPDRLAYPEFIPQEFRYKSFVNDPGHEIITLANHLEKRLLEFQQGSLPEPPEPGELKWTEMKPAYKKVFEL
jgi:glycosyltransferase involved in cell wall biosynthesis